MGPGQFFPFSSTLPPLESSIYTFLHFWLALGVFSSDEVGKRAGTVRSEVIKTESLPSSALSTAEQPEEE